jgi:hypothetical protein
MCVSLTRARPTGFRCANDTAQRGTIGKIPEQRPQRGGEAAQRGTADPSTQQRRYDALGNTPEEPCPEHPLEQRSFAASFFDSQ